MNHQKQYDSLIKNAGTRGQPEGYFERHHILPRSLGGSDKKSNVIDLTAREHYVAHLLLAKIHGGKMWFAANMMNRVAQNKNSHIYAMVVRESNKYRKELATPEWIEEQRVLQLQIHEERPHLSEEARERAFLQWEDPHFADTKNAQMATWREANPGHMNKMVALAHTPEALEKSSKTKKKRFATDPVFKARIIAPLVHYVKNHSEEISARTIAQFEDKDKRDYHQLKTIEAMNSPEVSKKVKAGLAKHWSKEGSREKQSQATLAVFGKTICVTFCNGEEETVFGAVVAERKFGCRHLGEMASGKWKRCKDGSFNKITCKAPAYAGRKIVSARYV